MATKTTIGNPQDAAFIRNRPNFEQAGINFENIEKILQSRSIASILSDFPLVANFLQKQYSRFTDLVYPKYGFKAAFAEAPPLEQYGEYYSSERDTSKGTPFVDHIESKYFSNPELFTSMGILTPQQVECLRKLMAEGCMADVEAMLGETSASELQKKSYAKSVSSKSKAKGYGGKGYGSATATISSDESDEEPTSGGDYGFKSYGSPGSAPGYPGSGTGVGGYDDDSIGWAGMAADLSEQQKQDIYNMVGDTPVAGFFGMLTDREDRAKAIYMDIFARMEKRSRLKEQIMMELNNLDMTTPEGQQRFQVLQQELGSLTQSEKEDYDFMVRVQQAQSEFISLLKKIFDEFYKTAEFIWRR